MQWCLGVTLWLVSGELCLSNGIPPEKRRNFTVYDHNGPLMLFTLKWASALVATQIGKTVLEEVFGYHVSDSDASWQMSKMMEAMSGCIKGKDCMTESNMLQPRCHLGFEGWHGQGLEGIPKANLPEVLGHLEYMGEEGLFMHPKIAEKYYATGRIVTIYSGLNSDVYNDFGEHFLTLKQLLEKPWKGGEKGGLALSDVGPLKRIRVQYDTGIYQKFSGDDAEDPSCYNITTGKLSKYTVGCGEAWVGPGARADPSSCIPLITCVDWGYFLIMMAGKYKWPICYITTNWANYVYLGNTYDILVYWWTPDTAFQNINPVEVRVPNFDGLAKSQGDWTTKQQSKLQVIAWQYLREGDGGRGNFLAKFGFNIAWYDSDANGWMTERAKGETDKAVACQWIKNNEARWRAWVPPMEAPCPVGEQLDVVSNDCTQCIPGSYASELNHQRIVWNCVTCDPGRATSVSGSAECGQCKSGEYADESGMTECKQCPTGSFQRAVGQAGCTVCGPGSFSVKKGQAKCELCQQGEYQSLEAQSGCKTCRESFTTETVGAATLAQCTCADTLYWNRATDICDPCQPEGLCSGGLAPPTVYEGNYGVFEGTVSEQQEHDKKNGDYTPAASAFSKLVIYTCRPQECMPEPGKPDKCAYKRTGIACGVCEPGYYLKSCVPCKGGGGPFAVLISACVCFPFVMWGGCLVCSAPYAAKATAAFQMAATFGILAIFAQMLGMMGAFNVDWPISFSSIFNLGAIFLLDLEGIGVGCVVGNSFASQFYTAFALPLFMAAGMFVMYPVSQVMPNIAGRVLKLGFNDCLNFLGMVYSALYISLVKLVVAFLECMPNPAAEATLAKYKQVVCGSPEHNVALPAMVLGMVFYVVGFFVLCLYLNIKAPRLFANPKFRAQCKFLVNRWRVDTWYWGSVYMVRNLCLAMIAVASSTAVDQFIMMAVVMVAFLVLGASYMPWKDIWLTHFDNVISFVVFLATACGIGFMHLASERNLYARDDSLRAQDARERIDSRILAFGTLLGVDLSVAIFLFVMLMVYCCWWQKNMDEVNRTTAAHLQKLVSRYVTLQEEADASFVNALQDYLESGTHVDIRSFATFLDNMEIRVNAAGGSESSSKVTRLQVTSPRDTAQAASTKRNNRTDEV